MLTTMREAAPSRRAVGPPELWSSPSLAWGSPAQLGSHPADVLLLLPARTPKGQAARRDADHVAKSFRLGVEERVTKKLVHEVGRLVAPRDIEEHEADAMMSPI